jgi:hypothetical protein
LIIFVTLKIVQARGRNPERTPVRMTMEEEQAASRLLAVMASVSG